MRKEAERKRLINDVCNNFGLSNQNDEISINWDGKDYGEGSLVENQLSLGVLIVMMVEISRKP